ncbi:MAG: hypothetical protein HYV07_24000 [Deltaproteobacteria bacterium]|nr:hypothetical protein [Deltaproteobacteria bacterium]
MTEWFVYLLELTDGTLYAGIATDVARRDLTNGGIARFQVTSDTPGSAVKVIMWNSSGTNDELQIRVDGGTWEYRNIPQAQYQAGWVRRDLSKSLTFGTYTVELRNYGSDFIALDALYLDYEYE